MSSSTSANEYSSPLCRPAPVTPALRVDDDPARLDEALRARAARARGAPPSGSSPGWRRARSRRRRGAGRRRARGGRSGRGRGAPGSGARSRTRWDSAPVAEAEGAGEVDDDLVRVDHRGGQARADFGRGGEHHRVHSLRHLRRVAVRPEDEIAREPQARGDRLARGRVRGAKREREAGVGREEPRGERARVARRADDADGWERCHDRGRQCARDGRAGVHHRSWRRGRRGRLRRQPPGRDAQKEHRPERGEPWRVSSARAEGGVIRGRCSCVRARFTPTGPCMSSRHGENGADQAPCQRACTPPPSSPGRLRPSPSPPPSARRFDGIGDPGRSFALSVGLQ